MKEELMKKPLLSRGSVYRLKLELVNQFIYGADEDLGMASEEKQESAEPASEEKVQEPEEKPSKEEEEQKSEEQKSEEAQQTDAEPVSEKE